MASRLKFIKLGCRKYSRCIVIRPTYGMSCLSILDYLAVFQQNYILRCDFAIAIQLFLRLVTVTLNSKQSWHYFTYIPNPTLGNISSLTLSRFVSSGKLFWFPLVMACFWQSPVSCLVRWRGNWCTDAIKLLQSAWLRGGKSTSGSHGSTRYLVELKLHLFEATNKEFIGSTCT